MSDRVIISRAHRDALYGVLLKGLADFEELLSLAIGEEPEDLEGSQRIGRRLAEALRLIQDGGIGWGYPQGEGTHELTLPPEELRRVIEAQRAGLAALEESERAQREEEERDWRQTREARAACNAVLDQLGGR